MVEKIVQLKTFFCQHNPALGLTRLIFEDGNGEVAGVEFPHAKTGVLLAGIRQQFASLPEGDVADVIPVTDLEAAEGPNGEPVLIVHSERLAPLPLLVSLDKLEAVELWLARARAKLEGREVKSQ